MLTSVIMRTDYCGFFLPEIPDLFSPTCCIWPLPHIIRKVSLVSSSPGLVSIICHFSSAKNYFWNGNIGSWNYPSSLGSCLCFFGHSCLLCSLPLISGLPLRFLFYLPTSMAGFILSQKGLVAGRHYHDHSFQFQMRNTGFKASCCNHRTICIERELGQSLPLPLVQVCEVVLKISKDGNFTCTLENLSLFFTTPEGIFSPRMQSDPHPPVVFSFLSQPCSPVDNW